ADPATPPAGRAARAHPVAGEPRLPGMAARGLARAPPRALRALLPTLGRPVGAAVSVVLAGGTQCRADPDARRRERDRAQARRRAGGPRGGTWLSFLVQHRRRLVSDRRRDRARAQGPGLRDRPPRAPPRP